jgi:hypothetical protein
MDPRKSYTSWGSRASRAYGPLSRALSCDVMSRSGCVDLDGEAGRIQQRSGGTAGCPLAQPKEENLRRKIVSGEGPGAFRRPPEWLPCRWGRFQRSRCRFPTSTLPPPRPQPSLT